MSDSEENTFSMILASDKFLDDNNAAVITDIPALAVHRADIKDLIAKVRRLNLDSTRPLSGFSITEANLRTDMMDRAISSGGGLEAYFKSINDTVKVGEVHLTNSQLEAARDGNVDTMCTRIVELGDPFEPGMIAYGVIEQELGELEGSITSYIANLQSGRVAVVERSAAGSKIPETLKAILTILYLIDDLMKTVKKSHDELYTAWGLVRITIDLHGGPVIPITGTRTVAPGEIVVADTIAYNANRRIKFHNLHPMQAILIGLSSIGTAYSNPPRILMPDSTSTLLSSTLAPDGDMIVFQNTSSEPITIEYTILD